MWHWCWRRALRVAYLGYQVLWWVLPMRHTGVFVALWHHDRILLVRNSYRAEWTLPGGLLKRDETALAGGLREAKEEVGLQLTASMVREIAVPRGVKLRRGEGIHFLEGTLTEAPPVRVDQREVVAAIWHSIPEALALPLLPAVRCYLLARQAERPSL